MTQKTEWGLHRAVPENARAVWGARGIFNARATDHDTSWDLVHKSLWGEDENTKNALMCMLDECRVFEAAYRVFQHKAKQGLIDRESDEIHTLYDCLGVKIKCSTNSSLGYVYISAWLEPHAVPLEALSRDSTGSDLLTWSNDELPKPGDQIVITINDIGPANVIDYFVESHQATQHHAGSNYLYLICQPTNPNELWRNQALRQLESERPMGMVACIMGREWEWKS